MNTVAFRYSSSDQNVPTMSSGDGENKWKAQSQSALDGVYQSAVERASQY